MIPHLIRLIHTWKLELQILVQCGKYDYPSLERYFAPFTCLLHLTPQRILKMRMQKVLYAIVEVVYSVTTTSDIKIRTFFLYLWSLLMPHSSYAFNKNWSWSWLSAFCGQERKYYRRAAYKHPLKTALVSLRAQFLNLDLTCCFWSRRNLKPSWKLKMLYLHEQNVYSRKNKYNNNTLWVGFVRV